MSASQKLVMTFFIVALLPGCAANRDAESSNGQTPGGPTSNQSGTQIASSTSTVPASADTYGPSGTAPVPGQANDGSGASVVERVIYFDFDSTVIKAESRPIVEAHARYLQQNPNVVSILEGHADERGSREYNIALGSRRAEAVRQLMSAYGITGQQLHTLSYGEERPAVAGRDETSFAQNRRVEIVY